MEISDLIKELKTHESKHTYMEVKVGIDPLNNEPCLVIMRYEQPIIYIHI